MTFKSENVEDCARVKLLSSKIQLCNITVLLKVGTVLFESQKYKAAPSRGAFHERDVHRAAVSYESNRILRQGSYRS